MRTVASSLGIAFVQAQPLKIEDSIIKTPWQMGKHGILVVCPHTQGRTEGPLKRASKIRKGQLKNIQSCSV